MQKIHFKTIDSTNTYLKNHYLDLEHLTLVSADYQSCGKGRTSRQWISEDSKNLLCSLLLKQDLSNYKAISIISAYALIKVLEKYNLRPMLKWPNDVYVNDKKIAGILLEGVSRDKLECIVIGIGINVNQTIFNGDYLVEPTSLKCELGLDINVDELKEVLYSSLIDCLDKLNKGYNFLDEIRSYDYLKNKKVYANIENTKQEVKVIGISEDYSLAIELKGKQMNIEAGEISFHC